jgi:hypothetical protein
MAEKIIKQISIFVSKSEDVELKGAYPVPEKDIGHTDIMIKKTLLWGRN